MEFLEDYYSSDTNGAIYVSADQGSRFAKQIADDFNPIHHPESRRFCVPGDLLFALALARYGIRESMEFQFLELLSADTQVFYPDLTPGADLNITIDNQNAKPTLGINCSGAASHDEILKESLVRNYVAFSGHNFPEILVPLMREKNVMFNPQRPLVIYQNMQLTFSNLDLQSIEVALAQTSLDVTGKRGTATLNFSLLDAGKPVGHGHKTLILSGLREYDETAIQSMREEYAASKLIYSG